MALAAGFIGGIVSQHIIPASVYAQAQTRIPKEVRAESFVIVDENGSPRGAFGIDKKHGWPTVEITNKNGRPFLARFDEEANFHKAKPELVPPQ